MKTYIDQYTLVRTMYVSKFEETNIKGEFFLVQFFLFLDKILIIARI